MKKPKVFKFLEFVISAKILILLYLIVSIISFEFYPASTYQFVQNGNKLYHVFVDSEKNMNPYFQLFLILVLPLLMTGLVIWLMYKRKLLTIMVVLVVCIVFEFSQGLFYIAFLSSGILIAWTSNDVRDYLRLDHLNS